MFSLYILGWLCKIIFIACGEEAKEKERLCGDGVWSNLVDSKQVKEENGMFQNFGYSSPYGFRFNYNQTTNFEENWKAFSCPFESIAHNCYVGESDRARRVENRIWLTHDKNCKPFHPADFLSSLRGRHLYFMGDSVMMQVWQNLMCTLYLTTEIEYHINWIIHSNKLVFNSLNCPFAELQCHLAIDEGRRSGYAHFPVFNTSISYLWYTKDTFEADDIESIFEYYDILPHDIVIFNYGIHSYQDWEKVKRQLLAYHTAVNQYHEEQAKQQEEYASPHHLNTLFFFLETFPQHFTNTLNGNGYYYFPHAGQHCVPHTSLRLKQYELDIRNRIADEIFLHRETDTAEESKGEGVRSLRKSHIPIIRIVEEVSSQYDAHGEGLDNMMININYKDPRFNADCTHWCAQAAVFQYVHRVIYNNIRHYLHHRGN